MGGFVPTYGVRSSRTPGLEDDSLSSSSGGGSVVIPLTMPSPPDWRLAADAAACTGFSSGGGASGTYVVQALLNRMAYRYVTVNDAATLMVAAKLPVFTGTSYLALEIQSSGAYTHSCAYSNDSTNGTDGTWTTLPAPVFPHVAEVKDRCHVARFPAATCSGKWVRYQILNTTGSGNSRIGMMGLYRVAPNQRTPFVMRIGDSITYQCVRSRRWRGRMVRDYGVYALCLNFGVSGERTAAVKNRLNGTTKQYLVDIPETGYATVEIGTNDVNAGKPYSSDPNKATITADWNSILDIINASNAADFPTIMAAADFDANGSLDGVAGITPYNTGIFIPAIVAKAPSIFVSAGRPVIDLETFTTSRFPGDYDPDGIHPSLAGAAVWDEYLMDLWAQTVMGTAPGAAYTPGHRVVLDGVDDFMQISAEDTADLNMLPTTAWSVSLLVKTTASGKTIMSKGAGNTASTRQFEAFLAAGGQLQVYVGGSGTTATGTTIINDGYWHHILIVCTGTTHRAWVDGVAQYTATATATQTLPYSFLVGARRISSDDDWSNNIAAEFQQLNFWTSALSDANAAAISANPYAVLVSSYPVAPTMHLSLGEDAWPLLRDRIGYLHSILWNSVSTAFQTVTANQAPIVNAGSDQTVAYTASASLSGTVSDPDSGPGPLTYLWSKVSGPGTVTFGTATAVSTTASFSAAGTYVLRLTASDGQASTSDDVQVIMSANVPPIVNAGSDQAITFPASASLVGTASDPDNAPTTPLTYLWSKVSGPGTVTFGTSTALTTTADFSVDGTYVLRLAAYDGLDTTTDDVQVVVSPSPGDFILLEDGSSFMLLEDGTSKVLLES